MDKKNVIAKIVQFNPNVVWEIDDPLLYGCIGWNGSLCEDSYWYEVNIMRYTLSDLKKCLTLLKKRRSEWHED